MAKESMKAREVKRAKMCAKYAEKRKEAGAVLESAVMIPISDEHLTNYPDAYTNH